MGSKPWTEDEEAYLIANYEKHGAEFISNVIDRSPSAIRTRFNKLKSETLPIEEEFFLSRANRATPKQAKKNPKGSIPTAKLAKKKTTRGNAYAHTKTGYRPDLGLVVRSGWESDVLRILKSYNIKYEFEPRVFTFPVKRGTKSYLPDIYLPDFDQYLEVKGWLDDKSRVKITRFARYYPEEFSNFVMIIGSSKKARELCEELKVPYVLNFNKLKSIYKDKIPNWESQ